MTDGNYFTAKWVYDTNGIQRERLIEADQVNVAYDGRTPNAPPVALMLGVYAVPPTGIVVLGNPESGAESLALTFGKVYIMNRDGRTVATYHLAKDCPWAVNGEADGPKVHAQGGWKGPGYSEVA